MLKTKVKQKRDWAETKNKGFWADFFVRKMWREKKGLTRNSRKSSKIKGLVTHTFKKKKRTEKEKKQNCRKRKTEDVFSNFLEKNIFSDTSKQERNKWETECLKEEKENNKGELRQKRETISQNTEKQYKAWKINVKHVQQKRETDKIVFVKRRKQKKKAKETIQDQEKQKIKNSAKSERNEKTQRDRENKWIEDEQKEGIKRQNRHSKRENVELVEVNVKSWRSEVSKWVNTNFQWQSFLWWKHDLVKNVVFEKKGEYVKGERKGRKSIIKSKRIFKKKRYIQKGQQKKRNMGKTDVQERDQKRRMSKKHKRRHTKKGKIGEKKKNREKDEHAKHTNLWICLTKRLKAFENAEVSNTCFS